MRAYTLAHLSDAVLLRDLAQLVAQDRITTATLLAHIAEVDARRLYVPAGYPSMHAYCVDELHLSEDAALKRIQAARAARQFPALLVLLAEGRLHLTAVCLLAPYLTPDNVNGLVEAASHRGKTEIREMLARRFPLPVEVPAVVRAVIAAPSPVPQHAPAHVGSDSSAEVAIHDVNSPGFIADPVVEVATAPADRYLLQLTLGRSTRDKLRYAQALLSHAVPSGDVAQVLDRALDALISQIEKRKLGVATRPPRQPRSTARNRYISTRVRRAVWERDGGQCTFVSATGHRCKAYKFLEFDHVDPVARGGRATVERIRLRCRTHNQYEAERTFGAGFMTRKRHEARLATAEARARAAAAKELSARELSAIEQSQDVLAGLRGLGCRADEARRAAAFTETLQGATLEERMRAALMFLSRRSDPGRLARGGVLSA